MSLPTYALISLDELKEDLQVSGSGQDSILERIIGRVTSEIEAFLERRIVTRTTADPLTRLTEYHNFAHYTSELRTLEYPIIAITTIHEDISLPPAYGASALLTSGTDYQVLAELGMIRRLSVGQPYPWLLGSRTVRIVYSAGYADTASVPDHIKDVALSMATRKFRNLQRGGDAAQQVQDGLGMVTRFLPGELLRVEKGALAIEQRIAFCKTGERAS